MSQEPQPRYSDEKAPSRGTDESQTVDNDNVDELVDRIEHDVVEEARQAGTPGHIGERENTPPTEPDDQAPS